MKNKRLNIHIGNVIKEKVIELNISKKSIMIEFRCSESSVSRMYNSPNLKTDILLKWSLFLDVNLFEVYVIEFFHLKHKL